MGWQWGGNGYPMGAHEGPKGGVSVGFYRKKPVVIEAFRWTGGPDQEEDPVWFLEAMMDGRVFFGVSSGSTSEKEKVGMFINTLEGPHEVSPGEWIIKGVEGEIYPCKDSVFTATYDPVQE